MQFFKKALTEASFESLIKFKNNIAGEYTTFRIPKRNGTYRLIDAPSDRLKTVQRELYGVLSRFLKPHPSAVGFIPGIPIEEGAKRHLGNRAVIGLDLLDFFPSITFYHVMKVTYIFANAWTGFVGEPLSQQEFRLLCLLLTLRGRLPQGAPTSPLIANMALYMADEEISHKAKTLGLTYTRYADDITLSHPDKSYDIGSVAQWLPTILAKHRVKVNWKKFRVMRPHNRMEVTGLVINRFISIPRNYIMKTKAQAHQMKLSVEAGEQPTLKAVQELAGKLAWICKKYPRPQISNGLRSLTTFKHLEHLLFKNYRKRPKWLNEALLLTKTLLK